LKFEEQASSSSKKYTAETYPPCKHIQNSGPIQFS